MSNAYAAEDAAAPSTTTGNDVQELKRMVADQQKQIEELRQMILGQQKQIQEAAIVPAAAVETAPTAPVAAPLTAKPTAHVASLTPILPPSIAAAPAPSVAVPPVVVPPPAPQAADQTSPLQIHIGDSTITPIGFMDLTNTFRSPNAGTNLQTNFGSFPYNNTIPGRLTEDKISVENSRLGFRVDATVKDWHVLGYFEGDFVGGYGNGANNGLVSSNSNLFRIRQYYVNLRKGTWEFLGGQAWSFITPNRRGLSALPADLFYSQVVDVNYMNGLFWGRIPGFRVIAHPSDKVAWGLSVENSTQYFGGSGGGGIPTLPAAFASNTAFISAELDNSSANDRATSNLIPDFISKLAIDPSSRLHFEIGGVTNTIKLWNPNTNQYFYKTGAGGTLVLHAELVKNFRVLTNNFWSNGNGRYLFGTIPDFIVRADGSPSLIHSMSTVSGFEATVKNVQPYVYYGGVYGSRNVALDTNHSFIGYGYPGSPNSHNRSIQEISAGWTHTLWRDGRYGALQYMVQYAYFWRNPWYVAANQPKNAHMNTVWFNLRYVLPGTAPTIKY
ncbi:MAG: hypothetical protein JO307_30095 [Bryobacterales bacterium]|nr:hypothetical protein [Bryobacterales bacterium]